MGLSLCGLNKKQIKMKKMRKMSKLLLKRIGTIRMARIVGAFVSIIFVAGIKYFISGDFKLDYSDIYNNVIVGIFAWIINESLIVWFTNFFNIKGINFNLYQITWGYDTIDGNKPSTDFKPKLYLAMESDDSLSGKTLDKGKGVDRSWAPSSNGEPSSSNATPQTNEATYATWQRVFPGLDPLSVFNPKRVNPGPGFNVPGGEVPIRDEICRHIDYNSHILKQFKTMDLEVAIQQRNNNLLLIDNLTHKIAYAQNALSKIPPIPTTDYDFRLKNQIISDLNGLAGNITRADARVKLLNSRIEFIEINVNNK
jgi:hypothetical protein